VEVFAPSTPNDSLNDKITVDCGRGMYFEDLIE